MTVILSGNGLLVTRTLDTIDLLNKRVETNTIDIAVIKSRLPKQ